MIARNDRHHPLDDFLRDYFDIFCRGLRLPPDDPLAALCGIARKRCRTICARYRVLTLDEVESEALIQMGMLVVTGDHAKKKWPVLNGLWLMHNRLIDRFRRTKREGEVMQDYATSLSFGHVIDEAIPDRELAMAHCAEALEIALAKLDSRDSEIVKLHVYEGLTFERVACELGMRTSTVHDRFKRAIARLRELVDADLFETVA